MARPRPFNFARHLGQMTRAIERAEIAGQLQALVEVARHVAACSTEPTAPAALARIESIAVEIATLAGIGRPVEGVRLGSAGRAAEHAVAATTWLGTYADVATGRVLRYALQEVRHALGRIDRAYGIHVGPAVPAAL